jgi:hypothetical protein
VKVTKLKLSPQPDSWFVSARNWLFGFDALRDFAQKNAQSMTLPVVLFITFAIFQTLNLFDVVSDLDPLQALCENLVIAFFWPLAIKTLLDWLSQ